MVTNLSNEFPPVHSTKRNCCSGGETRRECGRKIETWKPPWWAPPKAIESSCIVVSSIQNPCHETNCLPDDEKWRSRVVGRKRGTENEAPMFSSVFLLPRPVSKASHLTLQIMAGREDHPRPPPASLLTTDTSSLAWYYREEKHNPVSFPSFFLFRSLIFSVFSIKVTDKLFLA